MSDKNNNQFSDKRLKTFSKLGTQPTQWQCTHIGGYKPFFKIRNSGVPTTVWRPTYTIPDGYVNGFESDKDQDYFNHCQLCDTEHSRYGIIEHQEKKIWLKVGLTCFEKFENDDMRKLNLKVLKHFKEKYFTDLLHVEKVKLTDLVKTKTDNGIKFDYKFYSNCIRNRYVEYSVRKFSTFLIKNIYHIIKAGYLPDLKILSTHQFKKFIRIYAELKSKGPIENIDKKTVRELNDIAGKPYNLN